MASTRLFRIIIPASNIEAAAAYYASILEQPGKRVSLGRHYFGCGRAILACFDPRSEGDPWDAKPNPDHVYFTADDLDACYTRVTEQPKKLSSPHCSDPFGDELCFVDERTVFTGRLI